MIVITNNHANSTDVHFSGPTIYVCKNDEINVYLENSLSTESISLHWYGIHQENSPWMDGVQQVTQYPILPTQRFHYRFTADKVGTHWYHSHTGGQYTDGLLGMLFVGDPHDPYVDLPEHLMLINEWYHNDVVDIFDIFTNYKTDRYHPAFPFVSGLINGNDRFNCTPEQINNTRDPCIPKHPFTRFNVSQNKIYRLRIVAAASQFTYRFSIDQHELTIVAMDGIYVRPYSVQEMFIDIGQ
jgi:FtsP/CotA-like multicopper oxidase with cupredoxin domain